MNFRKGREQSIHSSDRKLEATRLLEDHQNNPFKNDTESHGRTLAQCAQGLGLSPTARVGLGWGDFEAQIKRVLVGEWEK